MSDERYEIRGKIGQGGVGAVYHAFDTHLNREVAIKRVLAEGGYEDQQDATKQLLKEATALSSVQHPHIVTVYDAGIDDDGPYVVMELIHGRTLDEMVERGTLTWNDLREVALQTQEALIAAQDLDLVHRDLKPSNVMVCWLPSGKFQVKIVDFGLAKFSATPSLQTIDHGDAVFGSIFFMAPEQFERTPLDKRTDMYALGCLYYYALTGQYPFSGDTAAEVMASHLQHHVTPLTELRPDVPQWGADWIMWHIERQMDQRPKDAREALERFLILDKQSTQPVTMSAPPSNTPPQSSPDPSPAKPRLVFPGATTPTQETQPQPKQAPATPVPQAAPVPLTSTPATAPAQQAEPAPPAPAPEEPAPETTRQQTAPQPISPPHAEISPHTKAQSIAGALQPTQPVAVPAQPTITPTQPAAPQPAPQVSLTGATEQTAPPTGQETPEEEHTLAETVASVRKTMPTGAKYAIISLLALVIIVTIVVGISIMGERSETTMVNEVLAEAKALNDKGELQHGIRLTEEELQGVLKRTTNMKETENRAILLKTLAYARPDGKYDINKAIIDHITTAKCPESIRVSVFKTVMCRRKDVKNISPLLNYAKYTTEDNAAAEAINAARYSAMGQGADTYITDFLNLIDSTDSPAIRAASERAAEQMISESPNKADFASSIHGSYESAVNDHTKFTMLRLLGSTGGKQAEEVVLSALNSGKPPYQAAALAALSNWSNDDQFEKLIEFIEQCDNETMRGKAFTAAYSFLNRERERAPEDLERFWKEFASCAKTRREKLQIISGMAKQKSEWAISVLDHFIQDEDDWVIDSAERAKERLQRRIREQR